MREQKRDAARPIWFISTTVNPFVARKRYACNDDNNYNCCYRHAAVYRGYPAHERMSILSYIYIRVGAPATLLYCVPCGRVEFRISCPVCKHCKRSFYSVRRQKKSTKTLSRHCFVAKFTPNEFAAYPPKIFIHFTVSPTEKRPMPMADLTRNRLNATNTV